MSENWGDLAKSQIDAETIEEAIDRLIQEHDDDPDSHLDTGQSLQSHKASEIIDHLANSIVRDKLEFDRYTIDCDFQSIDYWDGDGHFSSLHVNEMQIAPSDGIGNTALTYLNPGDAFQDQCSFNKSPNCQIRIFFYTWSDIDSHFGFFDQDFTVGIGFEIVDGVLYACWFDEDDVKQTEEILNLSYGTAYFFRVYYDYATTTASFYVNGALVHSVVVVPTMDTSTYFLIFLENQVASTDPYYLSNFHFDADRQI